MNIGKTCFLARYKRYFFITAILLIAFIAASQFKKEEPRPELVEVEETEVKPINRVNYDNFGAIHVVLDAPSYERSNFDVNPDTKIAFYFNEKVDPLSLDGKFVLKNIVTEQTTPANYILIDRDQSDEDEVFYYKWQQFWKQKAVYTLDESLESKTRYEVSVIGGFTEEESVENPQNGAGLKLEFMTSDDPGLHSANISSDEKMLESGLLKILFKSPMDLAEIQKNISVSPEVEDMDLTLVDKTLLIKNSFVPGLKYTLTILGETLDLYERPLGEDIVLKFNAR